MYTKTLLSSLASVAVYLKLQDPLLSSILAVGAGYFLTKIPGSFNKMYFDESNNKMLFAKYKKGNLVQREFYIDQISSLNINTNSKIAFISFKLPEDYNVFQIKFDNEETEKFVNYIDSQVLQRVQNIQAQAENKYQTEQKQQQKDKELENEEDIQIQQKSNGYKGRK